MKLQKLENGLVKKLFRLNIATLFQFVLFANARA